MNETTPQVRPQDPPTDALLRDRVVTAIRQRWLVPAPAVEHHPVPRGEVDAVAAEALRAMLVRPFRIGPLPAEAEHATLLQRVRYWVARGRPIKITLGYAPMKNQRVCHEPRADWAEAFALTHLCAWHNKVQSVYPPGLRIGIIFDDSAVRYANRPDPALMESYMTSVDRLVGALGYGSFLRAKSRQSAFAWLFNLGVYPVSWVRVWWWERNPANKPIIEQMEAYARRNTLPPPGLDAAGEERWYRAASRRYRVYWDALNLGMWLFGIQWFGRSLIAMYLDGQQHHVPRRGALHLATLAREQVTQPWQGQGALKDNGKGKLVPLVLTAGRRAQVVTREVTGLDILPLEGFDRIPVCWDKEPRSTEPSE